FVGQLSRVEPWRRGVGCINVWVGKRRIGWNLGLQAVGCWGDPSSHRLVRETEIAPHLIEPPVRKKRSKRRKSLARTGEPSFRWSAARALIPLLTHLSGPSQCSYSHVDPAGRGVSSEQAVQLRPGEASRCSPEGRKDRVGHRISESVAEDEFRRGFAVLP